MVILILFNTVHYSFNSQQLCHKYYYCWKSRNKKDFSFLLVQTMIVIQQKYIHKHFYHHLVTYILPTHSLHILLDCTCHLLLTHKEKLGALRQKDKKNNKLQLIQYLPLHFCFVLFFFLSSFCGRVNTVTQSDSISVPVTCISNDHALNQYDISYFSHIYMRFLLLFILMLSVQEMRQELLGSSLGNLPSSLNSGHTAHFSLPCCLSGCTLAVIEVQSLQTFGLYMLVRLSVQFSPKVLVNVLRLTCKFL